MPEIPNNPFAFWQQFWQNAAPNAAAFLPPTSTEEAQKRINELKNIELWLDFNLKALRAQIQMLETQKQILAVAEQNSAKE